MTSMYNIALEIKPTVRTILNEAENRLQHAGIEQPELSAGILIGSALNCPRLEIYLRLDEKLMPAQIETIRAGIRRMAEHEPIQYVLGRTDFMGHIFKCDPRALIPRPETEELVEFIIGHEPLWQIESPAIIDIGTGSGCIIISLALLKKKGKYWAVDVSADAIELARENAYMHGVLNVINFSTADVTGKTIPCLAKNFNVGAPLVGVRLKKGRAQARPLHSIHTELADEKIPPGMDAVVANPPYVRTADLRNLEKNIRLWEPHLALDGGEDGLQVIRPLIQKAYEMLKPDRFLFLEIGFDQWPAVQPLLVKTGFRRSVVRPDSSGHNRLVMATK